MVTPPEFFNFASDVLDNWARRRPEAPGLWRVDADRSGETILTFRKLAALSRQAANVFRAAGVGRGARVLIMLPRVPHWWIAMLGLVRVGAVPIPTTLQITPRELAYRLETAEVDAVVADAKSGPELDSFAGVRLAVGGEREGWIDFEASLREAPETFEAEPIRADDSRNHLLHQRHHGRAKDGDTHPGQLRPGPRGHRQTLARPPARRRPLEHFRRWLGEGRMVHEGYGQTETVILIGNFRSLGQPVRPGSMGKPAPGFDVALLDDQLQELPHGQEGQIAIRLAQGRPLGLFSGYWKSPAENAAHFKDGWYLTGDCAVRDIDGYYWFVGRGDDIIKSSGYRIGPFEVENALLEHEAVLEAAVVGKPDALRGQIVKAYVVLRPQFEASEGMKQRLVEHCRRLVAPYKKPREIEFAPSLPKTISSKILRKDLRRRA